MKFGITVFPGTNCDRDTYWVISSVLKQEARYIWHTESNVDDLDVIVIPGGFSYGDYLRAGAIAKISPVISAIIRHAKSGKLVLGICNGFQVLTECGLIPGAFLINNVTHFVCRHQHLKVANHRTAFTSGYSPEQVVRIPIAHGEGNYYAEGDDLKMIRDNDLIAFQYCDANGVVSDDTNPNGAILGIAGVTNKAGNVLGMMPHPERSSEKEMGSTDGKVLFESILNRVI